MSDALNIYDLNMSSFHFPGLDLYMSFTKQYVVLFDRNLKIKFKTKVQSDSFYDKNCVNAQVNNQHNILILNGHIFVQCFNRLYKLNLNSLEFVSVVRSQNRFVTFFAFNGFIFAHDQKIIYKLVDGQFQWFMGLNGTIFVFCNEIFVLNYYMRAIYKIKEDFSLEFVLKVNQDSEIEQINGTLLIIEQESVSNVIMMQNSKVHYNNYKTKFDKLQFNGLVTVDRKMCKDILEIDIQDITDFYEEYVKANVTLANLVPELDTKRISEQNVIDCYSRNSKSHTTTANGAGKYVFHDSTITTQINLKSQLYVAVTQNNLAVIDRYQNILEQSVDLQLDSNHTKIWQNQTICCGVTYVCVNSNIYSLVSSKLKLVAVVPDCTALFSMNDKLYAHSHNYVQLIKNGKPKRVQKVMGQIFQFCDTVFVFNRFQRNVCKLDSLFKTEGKVFNTRECQHLSFCSLGFIAISQSGSKELAVVDLLENNQRRWHSGQVFRSKPEFHENNILTNFKLGVGGFVPDEKTMPYLEQHREAYTAYILEQERRFPLQIQRALQKGKLPQYLVSSVTKQLGHNSQRIGLMEYSVQVLKRNTAKSLNRMQTLTNKMAGKMASAFTQELASNQRRKAVILNQLLPLHGNTFAYRLNKVAARLDRLQAAVKNNTVLEEAASRFEVMCVMYSGLACNEVTQ
ncbi:Conserved_hypothetical protein [Hexamita inflata]|uniref:Uncharacterized protein n=1 Tax=Hexamita inflata TaxID=28002 RepID=A0AA86NRL1_9EUKA|nr:Conserved hypothetical protein [Hexamita inflata]